MRIRYTKAHAYFPPLIPVKPMISTVDKRLAGLSRPPALPSHCKPWIDANSFGLLLRFPFDAKVVIRGNPGGKLDVQVTFGAYHPGVEDVLSIFSRFHFGLASGYRIRTDHGVGTYLTYLPDGFLGKAPLVRGLVETWWYPKPLFVVFQSPKAGEVITFESGDPLCVLMPVTCETLEAVELIGEEASELVREQIEYERQQTNDVRLRWTSAEGYSFSHLYKARSSRMRHSRE